MRIGSKNSSSIFLDLPTKKVVESKDLQRTKEWHLKRNGCWTGSMIKNVMACNSSGAKLDWSNPDKIYEFSTGVLKYIYSRAMQRKTNKVISTPSNAAMNYGTTVEEFICKIGSDMLGQEIKEVDFKTHDKIKTLGASGDGITKDGKTAIEIKACTNWETHYDRTFDKVNEKSTDFWQTQLEMMVWKVDKCAYLIAEPPQDIMEYVKGDKTFDDFKSECAVSMEFIDASPFHQNAILKRVEFIEDVCEEWIDKGGDLRELFYNKLDIIKCIELVDEQQRETDQDEQKELSMYDFIGDIEVKDIKLVKAYPEVEVKQLEVKPIKKVNYNEVPF